MVPAKLVPVFKPSRELKAVVLGEVAEVAEVAEPVLS